MKAVHLLCARFPLFLLFSPCLLFFSVLQSFLFGAVCVLCLGVLLRPSCTIVPSEHELCALFSNADDREKNARSWNPGCGTQLPNSTTTPGSAHSCECSLRDAGEKCANVRTYSRQYSHAVRQAARSMWNLCL